MSVAASAMLVPWGNTPRQQSYRPNTLVLLDGCWPATNGLLSPSEGWNEHPQDRGESWGGWGTGHFTPGADLTSKRKLALVEAASLRSANYCCVSVCLELPCALLVCLLLVRRNECCCGHSVVYRYTFGVFFVSSSPLFLHSLGSTLLLCSAHTSTRCAYADLYVYLCRLLHSNRTARATGENKPVQREAVASNKKSVVGIRRWRPDQNSLPAPGYRRKLPLQRRGSSEAALAVGPLRVTSLVVKPLAHGELYRRCGALQQAGCEVLSYVCTKGVEPCYFTVGVRLVGMVFCHYIRRIAARLQLCKE